jgi:hypothetical protein
MAGIVAVSISTTPPALACGAYFARRLPTTTVLTGSQLYNRTTKMVVARVDNATTITMTADYRGDVREFAAVIAVPTVLTREQIKIADGTLIDALDRWTAPRLIEHYDPDPCPSTKALDGSRLRSHPHQAPVASKAAPSPQALGVTVEAQYVVGEYDVAILSAQQSDGLLNWLNEAGYNVPPAAAPVLAQYIAEGMKFFVAKVNLQQQQALGFALLRPLQINYQSPKFMVPLRLSTINADGPQEMFIFLLTAHGRVESANYPTQAIPTDIEVPPFVKKDYAGFYRAVFDQLVASSGKRGVFIEHVSAAPARGPIGVAGLRRDKLEELGATWVGDKSDRIGEGEKVVLTRLHVRYDAVHFPADLMLTETSNVETLIGSFRINHPFTGHATCPEAYRYRAKVKARQDREKANLARLTGWPQRLIREKANSTR